MLETDGVELVRGTLRPPPVQAYSVAPARASPELRRNSRLLVRWCGDRPGAGCPEGSFRGSRERGDGRATGDHATKERGRRYPPLARWSSRENPPVPPVDRRSPRAVRVRREWGLGRAVLRSDPVRARVSSPVDERVLARSPTTTPRIAPADG